jgi:transglutaminase-like putative cysteine protease
MMEETFFCDFGHKAIQDRAEELRKGKDDRAELAKAVYHYVREEIVFGFDQYQIKASDTLQKGYGMCANKALLFVAFLRYLRVPSRLAFIPIKRDFLKPIWGFWYLTMAKILNHIIAEVYLSERWIAVDLTLDENSYEKLYLPSGVHWNIDWNGVDDCLLFKDDIVGSVEPYSDIDKAIRSNAGNPLPPKLILIPFLKFINRKMWKRSGIK